MSYDNRQRLMDYKVCFGTPEGKRVLLDLMVRNWMFHQTFDPKNPDVSTFRQGCRHTVLDIIQFIGMKPEDLADQITDEDVLRQFFNDEQTERKPN